MCTCSNSSRRDKYNKKFKSIEHIGKKGYIGGVGPLLSLPVGVGKLSTLSWIDEILVVVLKDTGTMC